MAALLYFTLVLLIRWGLPDGDCTRARAAWLAALMAVAAVLLFDANGGLVLLIVLVLVAHWLPERWLPYSWRNLTRVLGLLDTALALIVLSLIPSEMFGLSPREPVAALPDLLGKYLAMVIGGLLLANEANYLIRAVFQHFSLEPQMPSTNAAAGGLDEKEYNAGRVIGILERWLIYIVLVTAQNYTVIALVIAAKGFARFRQMDERPFAEYVLIGTLTSTLLTIVVAEVILRLPG